MTLIFSGFPKGKYEVTLVSSADPRHWLRLTNLEFDHQVGRITGRGNWRTNFGGKRKRPIGSGYHDCEHAHFVIPRRVLSLGSYWECSVWGTGRGAIDELTATCTYKNRGGRWMPIRSEVYTGKLRRWTA